MISNKSITARTMFTNKAVVLLLCLCIVLEMLYAQDGIFFLKASKNIPRIGKRSKNTNNDENFEKFFLKASKSVPRIGRRGSPSEINQEKENVKYPTWSDFADLFEFYPELFNAPELLRKLDDNQIMVDDPNAFDWDRIRVKRTNLPPMGFRSQEKPEYRFQE